MAEQFNSVTAQQVDVATMTMLYFAQHGDEAAKGLKEAIDSANKDARTRKQIEADQKQLQNQLSTLLAGINDSSKPTNLGEITKLLREIADNPKLSDRQRQTARDLIDAMNATGTSGRSHDKLPDAQFKKLRELAEKYPATGPVGENSRGSLLAWIDLNTGKKNGVTFIGTAKSQPKATAEDVHFINDTLKYLNQREEASEIDWASINPQLKALLTSHFDTLKPTDDMEDDSVRQVKIQLGLQEFNNAINGNSASAKAIHDTKKGVTDRI